MQVTDRQQTNNEPQEISQKAMIPRLWSPSRAMVSHDVELRNEDKG